MLYKCRRGLCLHGGVFCLCGQEIIGLGFRLRCCFSSGAGNRLRQAGWWLFDRLSDVFEQQRSLFCWLFVFNSSVAGAYFLVNGSLAPWRRVAVSLVNLLPGVLWIFLLACFFHGFRWKWMKYLCAFMLLGYAGVTCVADWFIMYQYEDLLDTSKLMILMGTDPSTAMEFLETYVYKPQVCVALLLAAAACAGLAAFVRRHSLGRRGCRLMCITLFFALVSNVIMGVQSYVKYTGVGRDMEFVRKSIFFDTAYSHLNILRITHDFLLGVANMGDEETVYAALDQLADQELVDAGTRQVPYVVFILGESTDRNHMSLYGYHLDTSPHLKERNARGELAVFDDTISCGNGTANVMSIVFNTSTKERDENVWWYKYPNMIDILRKAGYYAVWLSNQEPVGRWGNFDRYYAQRSDTCHFLHISGSAAGGGVAVAEYDEKLLQPLEDYLQANQQPKQYYTIHLEGTHENFWRRYPQSFAKFTADDEPGDNDEQKKLQAEYDNAVYYNDYVVDEIIRRFEDRNAIVFYISDHGMDVYDTGDFAGHTSEEKGSRHMVEVPFIVWASSGYKEQNPDVWARIKGAVHRPYRTDYLMHTIFDAIGVTSSSYEARYSVISDEYEPMKRIYSGVLYEKKRQ